jgi:hypothetical protein
LLKWSLNGLSLTVCNKKRLIRSLLKFRLALSYRDMNLSSAVAGLKIAHLLKITSAVESAVLSLTVPWLRVRVSQNPVFLGVSARLSSFSAESRGNTPPRRGWCW